MDEGDLAPLPLVPMDPSALTASCWPDVRNALLTLPPKNTLTEETDMLRANFDKLTRCLLLFPLLIHLGDLWTFVGFSFFYISPMDPKGGKCEMFPSLDCAAKHREA